MENIRKKVCCFALYFSHDLFYGDEDESGEFNKKKIIKISNFAEQVMSVYSNEEFKRHFRLERFQFKELLADLRIFHNPELKCGRSEIVLEKKLMIFIWYISNMESLRYSIQIRVGTYIHMSICINFLIFSIMFFIIL